MGVCSSCFHEDRKIYQEINRDRSESIQSQATTTTKQAVATNNQQEREKRKDSKIPNVNSKEKIGYLNLDSKNKAPSNSSVDRPKSHSADFSQKSEIKEVKVLHYSGLRHSIAQVPQGVRRDSGAWGGSVPSFFTTTNQALDIDDSLTPGKRRDSGSMPHEFQVCDSLTIEKPVGNWEDQFQRHDKTRRAPRPKVGSVRVEPLPVLRE